MTEHILNWRAKIEGDAVSADPETPRLIGMPTGLIRPNRQIQAAEHLSDAARNVLREALEALRSQAEKPGEPVRVSLRELHEEDLGTIADALGEGDVWAQIGGNASWNIVESVLTGLWRIEAVDADGNRSEWLEVAAVPQAVLAAAERMPRATISVPVELPAGAMNVGPLLAELQERSGSYKPDEPNHVINFTLFPLTDIDAELLTMVLGQIPLVIRSSGYGSCRMFATGLRRVWAVQFVNSMEKVILDTLEIGTVPSAAAAAREDFEDSAMRLAEILDAYSS